MGRARRSSWIAPTASSRASGLPTAARWTCTRYGSPRKERRCSRATRSRCRPTSRRSAAPGAANYCSRSSRRSMLRAAGCCSNGAASNIVPVSAWRTRRSPTRSIICMSTRWTHDPTAICWSPPAYAWALYKLERHSGRVMWTLGGSERTFRAGHGAQFTWQHDGQTRLRRARSRCSTTAPMVRP